MLQLNVEMNCYVIDPRFLNLARINVDNILPERPSLGEFKYKNSS